MWVLESVGTDWAAAAERLRGSPLAKGGTRPAFFVFICGNGIAHVHVKVLQGRRTEVE